MPYPNIYLVEAGHIVSEKANLPIDLEKVAILRMPSIPGAASFLTEGVTIRQYLADIKLSSGFAPARGTLEC
jgi:hypothetical protein